MQPSRLHSAAHLSRLVVMAELPEQNVDLTLSQAEALVLFAFLARFSRGEPLRIADPAEEQALRDLHAELQGQLVEPLMDDYEELLAVARSAVRPPVDGERG